MKGALIGLVVALSALWDGDCRAAPAARPAAVLPATKRAGVTLTKNDVLTIRQGRFFLGGRPFAEISFNKFDLFWEIFGLLQQNKDDTPEYRDMVASQDRALAELHAMGFHSIRFFALPWGIWDFRSVYGDPDRRARVFYKAMDTALDLCDKNHIQVVYSLGCANFTDTSLMDGKWVRGEEQARELIANPASRSRQEMGRYVDDVVNRYKSRKTILMWEISNEVTLSADISPGTNVYNGERMPTLGDVARFFDDVARRIKADDPLRLVSSGGSNMRGSQWHQYQAHSWDRDTVEEQDKALGLLYARSAVDVVDVHYYTSSEARQTPVIGPGGGEVDMDLRRNAEAARRIGKPLMVGEAGVTPVGHDDRPEDRKVYAQTPDYFDSDADPHAVPWVQKLCDEIVDAGPQLTYWWEYSSDRPQDKDPPDFTVKKGRTDAVLRVIVEANRRLKARLGGVGGVNRS